MKNSLRALAVGCTALAAAALLATAGKENTISAQPVAGEGPGYAVETFDYPLADKIPAVYGIRGSATQTAQVDMTVGTEEKSYDVAKDSFTPVGESADEQGRDHMLVEIRTSK